MGMNPDTNQFEMLADLEQRSAFIDKFYGDQSEDEIPVFEIGERLEIKGYIFEVRQISTEQLALCPIEKSSAEKAKE